MMKWIFRPLLPQVLVALGFCLGIGSAADAGDLHFSLRINNIESSRSPAAEAAAALWNDPMNRLLRDTNAELGHILLGQPGGITAPVLSIKFQAGVQPEIIARIIENSLVLSDTTIAELNWQRPPTDQMVERRFIEDFSRQLEAAVIRTAPIQATPNNTGATHTPVKENPTDAP